MATVLDTGKRGRGVRFSSSATICFTCLPIPRQADTPVERIPPTVIQFLKVQQVNHGSFPLALWTKPYISSKYPYSKVLVLFKK